MLVEAVSTVPIFSPSRMTVGSDSPTMRSSSRVFLARSSWITPTAELAIMSRPKAALMIEPVDSTIAHSTPRMALTRVKMLARRIWATLRPVPLPCVLTSPRFVRSATSAAVRPLVGSVAAGDSADTWSLVCANSTSFVGGRWDAAGVFHLFNSMTVAARPRPRFVL